MKRSGAGLGVYFGIALLAGGVILYEIALLRVFSFTIWHHFTFMVISVALLGFGVSGVALALRPALGTPSDTRASQWSLAFALSAPLTIFLLTRLPFDPTQLVEEPVQALYLALHYVGLALPFTFAGLGVVCLLHGHADRAGRVYGADLVGAGLGGLGAMAIIALVRVEGALLLAAAATAAAALSLVASSRGRWRLTCGVATVALMGMVPWAPGLLDIQPGPAKGLWRIFHGSGQFPDAKHLASGWDGLSRVDVVENAGTTGWTDSARATTPSPPQTLVVLDGDATTAIIEFDGDLSRLSFLEHTLPSAAHRAIRPEKVLVIGAGGGADVLSALYHGAEKVDAVEISPTVADMVTERFGDRGGALLFSRDDVTLHRGEGRAFVRRNKERYDLIQLSLIDTFAATASGAFSLAESYLYTVEAFEDYLSHLEPGGALAITRWGWVPPRETLRLCVVAHEALVRRGIEDPARHMVVLASGSLGSLIVTRDPWTQKDLRALGAVANEEGFIPVHVPGLSLDNPFTRFLKAKNKGVFIATYPYDVSAVTDERPFFFQFGRWGDLATFGESWRENPVVASGRVVLLAVLVQASLLALLLLIVPLVRRDRFSRQAISAGDRARVVGYFFLLGLAFMLVQIPLMQRITLFIGNPVQATALVLATILVAAGTGSAFSARLAPRERTPRLVFGALVLAIILAAWLLPALMRAALGLPDTVRALVTVLMLAPVGFLMGIPLPSGLDRLQAAGAESQIGWAWAANGCASVIGPVLATLVALDVGLGAVMLVGAALYATAHLVYEPWWVREVARE